MQASVSKFPISVTDTIGTRSTRALAREEGVKEIVRARHNFDRIRKALTKRMVKIKAERGILRLVDIGNVYCRDDSSFVPLTKKSALLVAGDQLTMDAMAGSHEHVMTTLTLSCVDLSTL